MNKTLAFAIGIYLSALVSPGMSDEKVLRLDDILTEAREKNPRIVSAEKSAEAAWARVPQTRAWDNPLVYIGREPGDMQMIGVEQMFSFPGKNTIKGRVAGAEAESVEHMRDRTILEVLVDVKHAFHHIVHWHRNIKINLENQDILRKFVKIAEVRYQLGKAPQEDVLKAQVEAGKLSNELVVLNQMKGSEEANLTRLLGRSEGTVLPPPESLPSPPVFSMKEDELYAMAGENRQEIRAARAAVRAGEKSRTLARLEYAPDIMVRAEWWRVNGSFDPLEENWGGMIGLKVPLWFLTKQRYGVKEANAVLDSAQANLRDIENRVRFEIRDAFLKVKAARAQLNIFDSGLLPQGEQALRVATASYQAGRQDFLTLLDSQRVLRELKISYNDALVNYYMTLGDLELAVGKELHVHH